MLLLIQETRLRVYDGCTLMLATAPITLNRPGLFSIQNSIGQSQTSKRDMQITQHLLQDNISATATGGVSSGNGVVVYGHH